MSKKNFRISVAIKRLDASKRKKLRIQQGIVLAVHDRGQAQGFASIIKVNHTQKLIAMALNKPQMRVELTQ